MPGRDNVVTFNEVYTTHRRLTFEFPEGEKPRDDDDEVILSFVDRANPAGPTYDVHLLPGAFHSFCGAVFSAQNESP